MAENEFGKNTIRQTADGLSGRMNIMKGIAHLAGFAVDARRILEGIDDALARRPELGEILRQHVKAHRNWTVMEDSSGNGTQWVVQQMDTLAEDVVAAFYAIANGKGVSHA